MGAHARHVELAQPRSAIELLTATVRLFLSHAILFAGVTALVTAPTVVLVDGIWSGGLEHEGAVRSDVVSLVLASVLPWVVMALHAVIVRDLAAGRVLSPWRALREALPRLPRAVVAVIAYWICLVAGLALLVVPGIWVSVACCFAPLAAVLEGEGPKGALQRSRMLVRGRWWPTLGALVLSAICFGLVGALVRDVLARLLDGGVAYLFALFVAETVTLSLTALFGTLLFFSLRAELARPELAAAAR